jgi:hypothetical protein
MAVRLCADKISYICMYPGIYAPVAIVMFGNRILHIQDSYVSWFVTIGSEVRVTPIR